MSSQEDLVTSTTTPIAEEDEISAMEREITEEDLSTESDTEEEEVRQAASMVLADDGSDMRQYVVYVQNDGTLLLDKTGILPPDADPACVFPLRLPVSKLTDPENPLPGATVIPFRAGGPTECQLQSLLYDVDKSEVVEAMGGVDIAKEDEAGVGQLLMEEKTKVVQKKKLVQVQVKEVGKSGGGGRKKEEVSSARSSSTPIVTAATTGSNTALAAAPGPGSDEKNRQNARARRSLRQQDRFEKQEAERIMAENQQMLQREKEEMMNSNSNSGSSVVVPPVQVQLPLHTLTPSGHVVGVALRQDEDEHSKRNPRRVRKLPAHLADDNYIHPMDEEPVDVDGVPELDKTDEDVEELEDVQGEEDDPNKLWCICRRPHNNRFMINCDGCDDWFHGKCVGVTKAQGKVIEDSHMQWHCPACKKAKKKEDKPRRPSDKRASNSQETDRRVSVDVAESDKKPRGRPAAAEEDKLDKGCIVCGNPARDNSVFCSNECVLKRRERDLTNKKKHPEKTRTEGRDKSDNFLSFHLIRSNPKKDEQRIQDETSEEFPLVKRDETRDSMDKKPPEPPKRQDSQSEKKLTDTSKRHDSQTEKKQPNTPKRQDSQTEKKTPDTPKRKDSHTEKKPPDTPKRQDSHPEKKRVDSPMRQDSKVKNVVPKRQDSQEKNAPSRQDSQKNTAAAAPTRPEKKRPELPKNRHDLQKKLELQMAQKRAEKKEGRVESDKKEVKLEKASPVKRQESLSRHDSSGEKKKHESLTRHDSSGEKKRHESLSRQDSSGDRKRLDSGSSERKKSEPSGKSDKSKESSVDKGKVESVQVERLLRENMKRSIQTILEEKMKEGTDIKEEALSPDVVAQQIEQELVKFYGSAGSFKCKAKFRSLIFNLKNPRSTLTASLLNGTLSASSLVRMDSAEMAPAELTEWRLNQSQKELEAIKRDELDKLTEAKKAELIEKGKEEKVMGAESEARKELEAVVGLQDDDNNKDKKGTEPEKKKSEKKEHHKRTKDRKKVDAESKSSINANAHRSEDATKPSRSEDSSKPSRSQVSTGSSSFASPFDSPKTTLLSSPELPSSTIKTSDFNLGPESSLKSPPLFKTKLIMPELGSLHAALFNVSHTSIEGIVFPDSPVPIVGRIAPEIVWDYVDKMKKSKELIVLRLAPATTADTDAYMTFFSYLASRGRLGVLGGISPPLKDVYLVPLDKYSPVHRSLLPFHGPGLPQERSHCILAVVTRTLEMKPRAKKARLEVVKSKVSKEKLEDDAGTSSTKMEDDKPYEPWEEEEVEQMEVVAVADGGEEHVTEELRKLNEQIARERQEIESISVAISRNVDLAKVGGIPGLDGEFEEEEEEIVDTDITVIEPPDTAAVPVPVPVSVPLALKNLPDTIDIDVDSSPEPMPPGLEDFRPLKKPLMDELNDEFFSGGPSLKNTKKIAINIKGIFATQLKKSEDAPLPLPEIADFPPLTEIPLPPDQPEIPLPLDEPPVDTSVPPPSMSFFMQQQTAPIFQHLAQAALSPSPTAKPTGFSILTQVKTVSQIQPQLMPFMSPDPIKPTQAFAAVAMASVSQIAVGPVQLPFAAKSKPVSEENWDEPEIESSRPPRDSSHSRDSRDTRDARDTRDTRSWEPPRGSRRFDGQGQDYERTESRVQTRDAPYNPQFKGRVFRRPGRGHWRRGDEQRSRDHRHRSRSRSRSPDRARDNLDRARGNSDRRESMDRARANVEKSPERVRRSGRRSRSPSPTHS